MKKLSLISTKMGCVNKIVESSILGKFWLPNMGHTQIWRIHSLAWDKARMLIASYIFKDLSDRILNGIYIHRMLLPRVNVHIVVYKPRPIWLFETRTYVYTTDVYIYITYLVLMCVYKLRQFISHSSLPHITQLFSSFWSKSPAVLINLKESA